MTNRPGPTPSTRYVVYQGDWPVGVYKDRHEAAKAFGVRDETITTWISPRWHEQARKNYENKTVRWDQTFVCERVDIEEEDDYSDLIWPPLSDIL